MQPIPSELHVITCITNPQRYRSRYVLYKDFEKRVLDAGARLTTVEAAFGERPLELQDTDRINHIALTTKTELWHKETMLNIGISQLPQDWKYVAWIDADVAFVRPDWVQETLHQLQHYHIIQMFSHAWDLSPTYTQLHSHRGFMWCWRNNIAPGKSYNAWHPGFAWAARREAIDQLGRLFDYAIAGAADRHMACSLIGRIEDSFPANVKNACPEYYEKLMIYQERALRHINKNVGYMDGLLLHYWHGKKVDRRYMDRWKILVDCKYDPELDLKKDWQGLWQIADHAVPLRDRLRDYFRQRNEDSIDVS